MGAEARWGMSPQFRKLRNAGWVRAGLILLGLVLLELVLQTTPAAAQMEVGGLNMNLTGTVGYTYAGALDQGSSSHGMGFTGNGNLTGNYYNPNFLNFNVSPFYNRTQDDSLYGTLTNTSGVSSSVNLFTGTHFPGTISYNKLFNSTGAYGVPGSDVGLAQHANTQGLAFGWSAAVPDWPTLIANYGINSADTDILGEQGSDAEKDHTLSLLSTYKWDGFRMTGQFLHRTTDTTFDEQLETDEGAVTTKSSSNSYGATVAHALPWSGGFGASVNHLTYGYQYEDADSGSNSGGSTTVNGNAAFHPTNKLALSFNSSYNDSLLGSVPQSILNTGTAVNMSTANSFHSELVGADVYYQLFRNLGFHADIDHENQSFLGHSYSATQFGGSVNYLFEHSLLQGLSVSFGAVDTAQQESNTGLGFVGTVNYNRKFHGWDVGGNFSYSQNVETALLLYTTSSYSYLASLRHRLGERTYFMAGYSGSHSGITANSGTTSSAERIFATFLHRGSSLNAFYTKSDGLAILTTTGLVPVPSTLPAQVIAPGSVTSYDSKGWGFSVAATPVKRLTISGGFAKSDGDTINPVLSIYTNNTLIDAIFQYRLRKIWLNGGYTRLQQSVGTPGQSPLMVTSYYLGFSRWFNFF
jgi:hypothetical protein